MDYAQTMNIVVEFGQGWTANLRDFLDVFDGLETHLNFTEGGHVTSICGCRPQRRRSGRSAESLPGKHSDENEMGLREVQDWTDMVAGSLG